MKRLIIMLLIASSAAVPTLAQSKSKAQKKYDLTIMTDKEQHRPHRGSRAHHALHLQHQGTEDHRRGLHGRRAVQLPDSAPAAW